MNREEDDDLTVVVSTETDETMVTSDETVVMNLSPGDAASDHTVAATRASRDETVVGGAVGRAPAADTSSAALVGGISQSGVPGGVPVAQGFDPRRPIAAVPGSAPWDSGPEVERGVSQGLPVIYRARPHQMGAPPQLGFDEVQRRIGPAPAAAAVAVRQGREALPSLERRERRGRVATLVLFAAVLFVSAVGLWGLASIVFGW